MPGHSRRLPPEAIAGVATRDHREPFQCSTSGVWFARPNHPTAHTSPVETADTSTSVLIVVTGFGTVTTRQCCPSQCSTSGLHTCADRTLVPTAQMSSGAIAVMLSSPTLAKPLPGVPEPATLHLVPL